MLATETGLRRAYNGNVTNEVAWNLIGRLPLINLQWVPYLELCSHAHPFTEDPQGRSSAAC